MTDSRQRIAPRSPFEEEIGFTRAVRVGDRIVTAGTIDDRRDTPADAGEQADRCFQQIADYLEELGSSLEDIVRVRMFVTDIADAERVSAAFSKHLKHVRPAATLVAISALALPAIKVEIEAEAIVSDAA